MPASVTAAVPWMSSLKQQTVVAVPGQERHGVGVGEILELDAAARIRFLHGRRELLEKVVVFCPGRAGWRRPR